MIRSLLVAGVLLLALPGALHAAPMDLPGPSASRYELVWGPAESGRRDASVAELSVEERKKIQAQLKLRRKLADVHQVLAFTTTGFILAAEVVGVINLVGLDTGSPTYDRLKPSLGSHRVLVGAALSTYLASGIAAWAMPPAYKANVAAATPGRKKVDSGDLHVALSVGHGIGMATMLATGILMANVADNKAWQPLAVAHTAAGFTTAALVLGAGIVINTL